MDTFVAEVVKLAGRRTEAYMCMSGRGGWSVLEVDGGATDRCSWAFGRVGLLGSEGCVSVVRCHESRMASTALPSPSLAASLTFHVKRQYLVFLQSWTGKAAFVFGLNEEEIVLYDAATMEPNIKERWCYADLKTIVANDKNGDEFTLETANTGSFAVRKSAKWTFTCCQRTRLLADLLQFKDQSLGEVNSGNVIFTVDLLDLVREKTRATLKVGSGGIEAQRRRDGREALFEVRYEDLAGMAVLADEDIEGGALVIKDQTGSAYVIFCARRDEIVHQIQSRMLRLGQKVLDVEGVGTVSLAALSELHDSKRCAEQNDMVCMWDWGIAGPIVAEHLPLSSFPAHRVQRRGSAGNGSGEECREGHTRCTLVLQDRFLVDVDLSNRTIAGWWDLEGISAIVCSSINAARFSLVYSYGFVEFDCMDRDSLLASVLHRASKNQIRVLLGDSHLCLLLLDAQVVVSRKAQNNTGSAILSAHLAAAEAMYVRKIASALEVSNSQAGDGDAMGLLVVSMARSLLANVDATGVQNFSDRNVLCSAVSVLAFHINASSFFDGSVGAVILLQAMSMLLTSFETFECILEIPHIVVMINRFFRVLSGVSMSSAAGSSVSSGGVDHGGPSKGLLVWHILKVLGSMITFKNGIHQKQPNLERLNAVEQHNRDELVSFQRAKLLITLLESNVGSTASASSIPSVSALNGSPLSPTAKKPMLVSLSSSSSSILIVHGLMELLCMLVCPTSNPVPHHENTSRETREVILKFLANHTTLLGLFSFDSPAINELAAMLMHEIVFSADKQQSGFVTKLRNDVLSDGTALSHFHSAVFGHNKRMRNQSRFMFSLWMDDFPEGLDLINNLLPDVFYSILTDQGTERSPSPASGEESTMTVLSPRWERFFLTFDSDHNHPKLVWNASCREELRIRLEDEIRILEKRRSATLRLNDATAAMSEAEIFGTRKAERPPVSTPVVWNYKEFRMQYTTHLQVAQVGHYFLEPLVSARSSAETFPIDKMEAPYLFHLVHNGILKVIVRQSRVRFTENRVMGIHLQVMEALVRFHHDALSAPRIGEVMDTIAMLMISLCQLLTEFESTLTANVQYLFNVINKALCLIQTMDSFFPNEVTHFVNAHGVEACVRILSLVPTVVPGSPESALCSTCLETLRGMCASHKVNDATGGVVWPLPAVRRKLGDDELFCVLVACLLANDERVIGQTAHLLAMVVENNPAVLRKLYFSGTYYFALMYGGSDSKAVEAISFLLKSTHEYQNYPLQEKLKRAGHRSYLSFILPDALVCYLCSHDHKAFASVLIGDYDNPEAIWNPGMRENMIGELKEHTLDYVRAIRTPSADGSLKRFQYMYDPLPPMHYPELNEEMYCSGYYLRNLCNSDKFQDWTIHEPADLLRSVLDAWRAENAKSTDEVSMSFVQAALVLGIDASTAESLNKSRLRKLYFDLARKFHPDRNPQAGKEKFEQINEAYEKLMLLVGGRMKISENDSNINECDVINLSLLLQTQIVLYTYHADVLKRFKYPMYHALITIVRRDAQFVDTLSSTCVKLMARTCAAHAGNAEELMRMGGFDIVICALRSAVGDDERQDLHEACMVALAAFTLTAEGRDAVASSYLAVAAVHEALSAPPGDQTRTVLQAAFHVASNISLQGSLKERSTFVEKGLLYALMAWALGREQAANQAECASAAVQSIFALAGYRTSGAVGQVWDEQHDYVRAAVEILLSRPLVHQSAKLLADGSIVGGSLPACVELLHSECFSPTLIWNREMRKNVVDYCESRANDFSAANFFEQDDEEDALDETEKFFRKELGSVQAFSHSILSDHILVGEVYLEPFVTHSERFNGLDALKFTKDLLEHMRASRGVDIDVLAYKSLRILLDEMQTYKACVAMLSGEHVTVLYRLVEHLRKSSSSATGTRRPSRGGRSVDVLELELTLYLLRASAKSAAACAVLLDAGTLVDLLYVVIDSSFPIAERVLSASIFAHILTQRTTKAQSMRESFNRLVPKPLLKLLLDPSASTSVPVDFDNLHDTPELQWDQTCRAELYAAVSHLKSELFQESRLHGVDSIRWNLPGEDEFQLNYTLHHGRFVVAGVFIKRFLKDPGSVMTTPLSDPLGFAQGLVTMMKQTMATDEKELKYFVQTCQSFVALLKHYPIADEIASLGLVPEFFKMLGALAGSGAKGLVLCECFVRNAMAMCTSRIAVEQAAVANGIPAVILLLHSSLPMSSIGQASPSSRLASQCLALVEQMIVVGGDMKVLMQQIMESECLGTLIRYLEWVSGPHLPPAQEGDVDYSVHLRVFAVSIIKRLSENGLAGANTRKTLEGNKIWARYKNQDESLYLTRENVTELLEGGSSTLYLTE